MCRRIAPQPSRRLLELALAAGAVAAFRVEPRDGHVNESLQEVPLLGRRISPLVLELLVRLEVLTAANQLQAALEAHGGIISVGREC